MRNHGNYIGIETLFQIDQATFICTCCRVATKMWGKLKFKVLRKVHISELFQTILSKILLNFPKKSSQSST